MKKLKKELSGLVILLAMIISIVTLIDFIRFPECYVPDWCRSMKAEIDAGNEKVIERYNEKYVAKGRVLFE